jgi:hypothetical protein
MDSAQRIKDIHTWFCTATGQRLALAFDRERLWFEIFKAGFNEEDVRRLVRYLMMEIAKGKRNAGSLKLSNMLNPEKFEDDLNLSRVKFTQEFTLPPLPGKERAPSAKPGTASKPSPEAEAKAIEELKKFKKETWGK